MKKSTLAAGLLAFGMLSAPASAAGNSWWVLDFSSSTCRTQANLRAEYHILITPSQYEKEMRAEGALPVVNISRDADEKPSIVVVTTNDGQQVWFFANPDLCEAKRLIFIKKGLLRQPGELE